MLASYRDLDVWKLSMDIVQEVYRITRAMPSDERFGLTSQAEACRGFHPRKHR